MDYNTHKPRSPKITVKMSGKHQRFSNSEIKAAAEFFLKTLFAGKRYRIEVSISNRKDLKRKEGYCGYCERLDGMRDPRRFRIALDNNLGRQETFETLAHETVHVAQYVTNTMIDRAGGAVIFNERRYMIDNDDPAMYYFAPWEIDAYGRSIGLVVLWRIHSRDKAKKR